VNIRSDTADRQADPVNPGQGFGHGYPRFLDHYIYNTSEVQTLIFLSLLVGSGSILTKRRAVVTVLLALLYRRTLFIDTGAINSYRPRPCTKDIIPVLLSFDIIKLGFSDRISTGRLGSTLDRAKLVEGDRFAIDPASDLRAVVVGRAERGILVMGGSRGPG
jgi:hypothetical protein